MKITWSLRYCKQCSYECNVDVRVQQGHSLREEAVLEPTGLGAEAPVTPAVREDGEKKSMARTRDILDDV